MPLLLCPTILCPKIACAIFIHLFSEVNFCSNTVSKPPRVNSFGLLHFGIDAPFLETLDVFLVFSIATP